MAKNSHKKEALNSTLSSIKKMLESKEKNSIEEDKVILLTDIVKKGKSLPKNERKNNNISDIKNLLTSIQETSQNVVKTSPAENFDEPKLSLIF